MSDMYTVMSFVIFCVCIFRVNDDTEMLSPGWTEVYVNALKVRMNTVYLGLFYAKMLT